MTTPAIYNLPSAYRGDSYGPITFKFKNEEESPDYINFTGSRVDLQVRNKRFKDIIVLNWSTSNGSIEISDTAILLKQINGENMKIPPGAYLYDMQIIKDGITKTYLKGDFTIVDDITEI
jgi:hypothetical protein